MNDIGHSKIACYSRDNQLAICAPAPCELNGDDHDPILFRERCAPVCAIIFLAAISAKNVKSRPSLLALVVYLQEWCERNRSSRRGRLSIKAITYVVGPSIRVAGLCR